MLFMKQPDCWPSMTQCELSDSLWWSIRGEAQWAGIGFLASRVGSQHWRIPEATAQSVRWKFPIALLNVLDRWMIRACYRFTRSLIAKVHFTYTNGSLILLYIQILKKHPYFSSFMELNGSVLLFFMCSVSHPSLIEILLTKHNWFFCRTKTSEILQITRLGAWNPILGKDSSERGCLLGLP